MRCLCFSNLWKNVCCSIIQTMEILDKEKKRHCQEGSMHPFQTTEHGEVILLKCNMLPAAGASKAQSHSCQPQWVPGVQFRNLWSSTGHRSQIQPPQALQLGQVCCAGLRQPRVPKKICHKLFTHNHLASILPSCSHS